MARAFAVFGPLPEDSLREVISLFERRSLPKGAHWQRPGETATQVGIVESGVLRMYYLTRGGKEHNKAFVCEGGFAAALEAVLSGELSSLSIQALSPATLWVAEYSRFAPFYERHMAWQRLGRLIAEATYIKKARREAALLTLSAADRYAQFVTENAALERRIPDRHIASYLGITPEALSRIKHAARHS